MEKLIEVKNVSKSFELSSGGFLSGPKEYVHALNGINLDVYKGEILGLVGESGCGKSTLGRCILNLIPTTMGDITYKGSNISCLSKCEKKSFTKRAQLIFQNPFSSLNPKMRIKEILEEPLRVNGLKDREVLDESIRRICEVVNIDKEDLKRYPHEFSGGQRQRIAIARSLILNPEFVVADEPVSALDVSIQAQIINLLIDLKKEFKLTYLFISHDLSVIRYLCDRVAVMYLGEIVEIGTKEEIFSNPMHPYTRALLSSALHIDKRGKTALLKGDIPSPTNLPEGCKFYSRCPASSPVCSLESAKPIELSPTHSYYCHKNKPLK